MYSHIHMHIIWINQNTETSLRLWSKAVAEQEMEAKKTLINSCNRSTLFMCESLTHNYSDNK